MRIRSRLQGGTDARAGGAERLRVVGDPDAAGTIRDVEAREVLVRDPLRPRELRDRDGRARGSAERGLREPHPLRDLREQRLLVLALLVAVEVDAVGVAHEDGQRVMLVLVEWTACPVLRSLLRLGGAKDAAHVSEPVEDGFSRFSVADWRGTIGVSQVALPGPVPFQRGRAFLLRPTRPIAVL